MMGIMYPGTYGGLVIILCISVLKCEIKTCEDFKSCNCTFTTLECIGTFGESAGALRTFPRQLEEITISGNNFTDKLDINLFGSCAGNTGNQMTSLRYLDLSNNNITQIHGKSFHCISGVETLILSHNNWHIGGHNNTLSSLTSLKRLILENTFFEKINGTGHLVKLATYLGTTPLLNLVELNLAGNEFYFIPNATHNILCKLKHLKTLDLSNNLFYNVTICAEMDNLEVINLSHNHLPWLGDQLMENITRMKKLKKLYVDGNIFQCDCGMRNFYKWLKNESLSYVVQGRHQLTCGISYNTVDEGRKIMDLSLDDLKCGHKTESGLASNATGIVVGLLFGVIIVMFIIALYYNRVIVKNTWKRLVGKPVTLSLIPQSQGYATVENSLGRM